MTRRAALVELLLGAPYDLLLGRKTYEIFAAYILALCARWQPHRRQVQRDRQARPLARQ
jgi:hypothetical protein